MPVQRWQVLKNFIAYEVPRAVWQERKQVYRAASVLVVGLVVGFSLAFASRDMALLLVGDQMIHMVEKGANWTNQIEQSGKFAEVSIEVILNNVAVGLRAFAFGLAGALITLLILFWNGLAIGATFGYATQLQTVSTLATFILAHGPVELTMVCVAGAGGMCLGRGLLSPGHRTRMQALREEGAQGIRLVAAATMGFCLIGTVEGFISPGQYFPWQVNLILGISLWGLFLLWVRVFGRRSGA